MEEKLMFKIDLTTLTIYTMMAYMFFRMFLWMVGIAL